jgi:hypothetical protein
MAADLADDFSYSSLVPALMFFSHLYALKSNYIEAC